MSAAQQTAIRGAATTGVLNGTSRLVAFGGHVAVTAFYGLSAELDAYFVAMTVVTLTFLILGDGFDSIGVPPLVEVAQSEGNRRFRELAGALVTLACGVSLGLGMAVALFLPLAHWVAPGLRVDVVPLVSGNLLRLAPLALLVLPARAAASILRAQRRFTLAASSELGSAAAVLLAVILLRGRPYGVAVATSAGAVAGAFILAFMIGGLPRFDLEALPSDLRLLSVRLLALLPVYGVLQLFKISDRVFASFLPDGAIAAISYGQFVILVPSAVLALENVFMTPLAENRDQGPLLRRIFEGLLILTIPLAAFATCFAPALIAAAFQRGRFDESAARLTAEALQGFGPGLPAIFAWPILFRLYQIRGRTSVILRLSVAAFLANCAFNALFLVIGLGVRGLALATTLSGYALVAGGLYPLRRDFNREARRRVLSLSVQVAAASAMGLALALVVPTPSQPVWLLLVRGTVFVGAVSTLLVFAPAAGLREWRRTLAIELLPRKRNS